MDGPWAERSQASAPDGWPAVVELCESVAADLPQLVTSAVDRIRQEIPGYRVVDRADHELGVTRQYEGLLTGLATRRPPTPEENEHARALGRQRAHEGLPLEAMISGFHVGYREMWNVLLTRADARDERLSSQLVRLVGTVWTWVQQASSAAADAYGEAIRAEDASQLSSTYRFLEALHTQSPDAVGLAQLARALSYDPAGTFQAVCAPAVGWSDERLAELRTGMHRRRGTMRCANRGTTMVALVQNVEVDGLTEAMRRYDQRMPIGIGLSRVGLAGAVASVIDAEEVLPLALRARRAVSFESEWLLATLLPSATRLAALLEQCREPATTHPRVADTVRGFAENGLSLTAAGRALHLHPNTVKYRLERWHQLTGWDARTWDGLSASILALGLFAGHTRGEAAPDG